MWKPAIDIYFSSITSTHLSLRMFYKGEGVLPCMAYSGQTLPQGVLSWLWRQSQGKAPWGRGCVRGSVLLDLSVLKRYIISLESANGVLPGVLPARSIWFAIWTFFYLYFNYKKAMTITWICSCVRSVLFPKQGNRIRVVVLINRVILNAF